jgi:hypothetical protein
LSELSPGCENCDAPGGGDDLDMWRWDTGGGCDTADPDTAAKFCLEEEEEDTDPPGTSWCPDEKVENRHDPFAIPYMDETKVYWKEGIGEGAIIWVGYTTNNGHSFDDITQVEFYFEEDDTDGGLGDELDPACVEDATTTIWKNGTNVHELMVFLPMTTVQDGDDLRCFCTQDTAIDPDDSGFDEYPGMLTAILWNG